jgi:ubiquinone/menaquinone biosynthesis C-methylase UbiE
MRPRGFDLGFVVDTGDDVTTAYYENVGRAKTLAETYRDQTALGHLYRVRMERILELLEPCRGGPLLEVGCGSGQMLRFLGERRPGDFALVGLDLSSAMIATARETVGDAPVDLLVGHAESLPFDDESFEVVLGIGVLEYTQLDLALAEAARVVRVGGRVVLTMQNPRSPYRIWDRLLYRHVRHLQGAAESPVRQVLAEEELVQRLGDVGLSIDDAVYYDFNVFPSPLDTLMSGLELRISRRLERHGRDWLRTLGTGYIVRASRTAHA